MGGEPLCSENLLLTYAVAKTVREILPDTKIYVWTGYTYDNLVELDNNYLKQILSLTDCIIDGPYIEELKDTTLPMRGSTNQRIIYLSHD